MQSRYICNTGGADGSDKKWQMVGADFGVETRIWTPKDLKNLSPQEESMMIRDFVNAAKALGRPTEFRGKELVYRDWLQMYHSLSIYAIGEILMPGDIGRKGFVNNSGKEVVDGGTGWTVEMGIQARKDVFVFDMIDGTWRMWDPVIDEFVLLVSGAPKLTKRFAGIGSRIITKEGEQAINDCYSRTFTTH